jgi:hypothetical protein
MKEPRVLGLVLCKRMAIDVAAAEMSLVGVFNRLEFDAWPAIVESFTVYTTLTGGEGQGKIELTIMRLDTEETVYRHQHWTGFADPGMVVALEIIVRRCVFPAAGRYAVTLRFDNQELANRPLDVLTRRPR